jgi:hypothetical protein
MVAIEDQCVACAIIGIDVQVLFCDIHKSLMPWFWKLSVNKEGNLMRWQAEGLAQ